MSWQPILLFALAGFLVGGVIASWRNEIRWLAVALALIVIALVAGGVVWLLPA